MPRSSNHSLSRRTFFGTVAAVPLAARLDALTAPAGKRMRVAVIGAGAFGGWTALHLQRLGAEVVLIDAWGPGNSRSSSGGETRVIRAIYGADRIYTEMVKRSWEQWETLDASIEEKVYVETGALWLHRGDDAYVRSSAKILEDLGFPLEKLSLEETRRRYPQIDLRGITTVWFESRAGALSARRACMAVRDAFEQSGGSYRTSHTVPGAIANGAMAALRLEDGSQISADAYVFACGPWLGKVFPDVIGERVKPTRQEVFYFGTPRGSERYRPGRFPVWIDFGERIHYGIPDVDGRGFKLADDTRGAEFDPTDGNRTATAEGIARARQFLAERFPELAAAPLLSAEVCQYENSPDGHLIVDRHPEASNVFLVGGGSGHGFKLSPAVGEMVAQRIVASQELPAHFRLDRLRDVARPSTQFDVKK